jgi:hypothetical protein
MQPDLERMNADLAALRRATGLDPLWTGEDVRTLWLVAAAGAATALWTVIPHGLPPVLGLAAFAVPVARWFWRARARPSRSAADDREWAESLRVWWYLVPLGAFAAWSRAIQLEPLTMAGLLWFMVGLAMFGGAVGEKSARPLLAWSAAFMTGGLLVPLGVLPMVAAVGIGVFLGASATALWIAAELRGSAEG